MKAGVKGAGGSSLFALYISNLEGGNVPFAIPMGSDGEGFVSLIRKECLREGADLTEHSFPSYVKTNSILIRIIARTAHKHTPKECVRQMQARDREREER